MVKKVKLISLGCAKNRVDSEYLIGNLLASGLGIASEGERADACIINTCSFLESACDEAIEVILQCAEEKKRGEIGSIIVAGCMPNRYGSELAEQMPEIDGVISPGEYGRVAEIVDKALGGAKPEFWGDRGYLGMGGNRVLTNAGHYAYLKICDGCDNRCSYCMIPEIRGRLQSKPFEAVVEEAETLVDKGVKELVLIAQDTTVYGMDLYGKHRIAELLVRLSGIAGLRWIRLMYAYPDRVGDELVSLFKDGLGGKLLPYIDLPIQHGSDPVLSAMNRTGTSAGILETVSKLRSARPEMVIRSTFMVGFPGETERDFSRLLDFISSVKPQRAGVFKFSPEEGTEAAVMPDQVPEAVKSEREEAAMKLLASISRQFNEQRIGDVVEVMVDGPSEDSELLVNARSYAEAPEEDGNIIIGDATLQAGTMLKVRIAGAADYDLSADLV